MAKRIAIVTLVILVSGLAILGYFLNQGRKNLATDPYRAISADACVVIETIDLQKFFSSITSGSGLFSDIGKISELSSFNTKVKYLSERLNKAELNRFLHAGTSLIAFYPSGDGRMVPFLSMAIPPESGPRQIREAITASGVTGITEIKTGGNRIITVPFTVGDTKDTVFMRAGYGLLLCSTSRKLVVNANVTDEKATDIRNTPGFSKILLSSGKNEDKIFVIFSNLSKVTGSLFAPDAGNISESLKRLGGIYGGDLFINDDGIAVSGYIQTESPSQFFNRFISVKPGEFSTNKVLPAATAFFESFMITSELYAGETKAPVTGEAKNLAERLRPFIGDEVTKAVIDIKESPVGENSVIVCELNNRVECEKIINENIDRKSDIGYFQPDDQTRIPVYHPLKEGGLLAALMPGLKNGMKESYYTFFDNLLVAGNSFNTLSRFLYDNILNKTLANEPRYRDFEKLVPSRSGYLLYCVPAHVIGYFARSLNPQIILGLKDNMNPLVKIQSVGFQLAPINGMIYNSLSVKYNDEIREESQAEWETLLDTTACIKPFFFTNHNTGAKEIFVQDLNNFVYLINAAGRVLWKVPVNERINGQVYMIDYYKNGKYQLLFAGKNSLHILDRNGNYVDRYPVKLRSPAANPLALFDFDSNLDYRLVIAGEDKLVYEYEKSGKVVKGWKPFRTAGTVTSEACSFRISGKDYIVVSDESSVYFLDRSGNVNLNLKEPVTRAKGSSLKLMPGSETSLVCSSPDGTVQNIYPNGEVKKFSFRPFSTDHSFDVFDVDGDGNGEYFFIDKGVLYLYDHDLKEMFSRDFSSDRLGGPITFTFSSSDRKIGVFDINKNLIYLVNKKGEIMTGFPLRGASMFSIGKISSRNNWHLIVGGTDRFLYNYAID